MPAHPLAVAHGLVPAETESAPSRGDCMPAFSYLALLALFSASAIAAVAQGGEFQIHPSAPGNQDMPLVAVDNSGRALFVWRSRTSSADWTINRRSFFADGSAGSSQVLLSFTGTTLLGATTGAVYSRFLATTPRGVALHARETQGDVAPRVVALRYSADGDYIDSLPIFAVVGLGLSLNEYGETTTVTNVPTGPDFVRAGSPPRNSVISARRISLAGAPLFTVDASSEKPNIGNAVVASAPDGRFVVVWEAPVASADAGDSWGQLNVNIWARVFNADGTPRGNEFQANNQSLGFQWDPVVEMDAAGNFVIAWGSYLNATNKSTIQARRFNAQGVAFGDEFAVNTDTTGSHAVPVLAMNPTGAFVVAWTNTVDGNADVYAREFNSAAVPLAQQFRVNEYAVDAQTQIAIDMNAAGVWAATWTSALQDGDQGGVYGRRFQHGAPGVPVDLLPRALAGLEKEVKENTSVTLDGSSSFDPYEATVRYAWRQIEGVPVTLSGATTAKPTFTAPLVTGTAETVLRFELTVYDAAGQSDSEVVTIKVKDASPEARAGADLRVNIGQDVSLDGSASFDPDGYIVSYQWTLVQGQVSGLTDTSSPVLNSDGNMPLNSVPSSGLTDPSSPVQRFKVVNGMGWSNGLFVELKLVVTDNSGLSSEDRVVLNVNQPPIARAGEDRTVLATDDVTLDGSASTDADGNIVAYRWSQSSGPTAVLTGTNNARVHVAIPQNVADGTKLVFWLSVTDNEGSSVYDDDVTLTVRLGNRYPVAVAGADVQANERTQVQLSGAGSYDPEGEALTYRWTQLSGPDAHLGLPTAAESIVSFTAPDVAQTGANLVFELAVTDSVGLTHRDTVNVSINNVNRPPRARLFFTPGGVDEGNVVWLYAEPFSADPDGDNVSYQWLQFSGPSVTLTGATTDAVSFRAPQTDENGTSVGIRLFVTDEGGLSGTADAVVNVRDVPPPPPPPTGGFGTGVTDGTGNGGSSASADFNGNQGEQFTSDPNANNNNSGAPNGAPTTVDGGPQAPTVAPAGGGGRLSLWFLLLLATKWWLYRHTKPTERNVG